LLLIKLKSAPGQSATVASLLEQFGAKVLSSNPSNQIIELTSTEAEIGAFITKIGACGEIAEVVRSGVLGIARSNPRLHVIR
jgi:acetolactate synthase small subunit